MPPIFLSICDTLVHLIQDALICFHSFYAFVIHSRTWIDTGWTDMPLFLVCVYEKIS